VGPNEEVVEMLDSGTYKSHFFVFCDSFNMGFISLSGYISLNSLIMYRKVNKTYLQQINHAIVSTLTFLGLAPKGVMEVHEMLVNVAHSLVAGGETGIFSPSECLFLCC
jgi:hypothetical protein